MVDSMERSLSSIEKKLYSQVDISSFLIKKIFYLNTGKLAKFDADEIERKFRKNEIENKKRRVNISLLKLLSSFDFEKAEILYSDNLDCVNEVDYFIERNRFKRAHDVERFLDSICVLSKNIVGERSRQEKALKYLLTPMSLSGLKRKQYIIRLNNLKADDKWGECNTWLYTAAEYALELWAGNNALEFVDYNQEDIYSPRDCAISNVHLDVKTTMGVGRRVLPKYNNVSDCEEIMVGVGSLVNSRDERASIHKIHGIYDKQYYQGINLELKYYTHDSKYLNSCYFSSLESYFKTKVDIKRVPLISNYESNLDDIRNRSALNALFFSIEDEDKISLLYRLLPDYHVDFIEIIRELLEKDRLTLLPHFLADYILGNIIEKRQISRKAIEDIIYSIFMPYESQKTYIDNLLKAKEAIANVECVNHVGESIEQMEIEFYAGAKPTLKACCSYNQTVKTTFFTYSWKTGETLIYGQRRNTGGARNEIPETCDLADCGCLTHKHDGRKIGKRSCGKYGEGFNATFNQ